MSRPKMSKNKKKKLKKRAKRHQPLMEETQALGNQAVRDSSSSEDEQERAVHQEPAKNSLRENEHGIIRDYIYNWKMSLENGLKKAKDHVLKKSSYTMKEKFEELKELGEFVKMLKSSTDDFEHELFKISEIISKKCACIYSCNCKCLDDTYANFMSHLYKLVYETFTSFEEFLTDRYSHLYQN